MPTPLTGLTPGGPRRVPPTAGTDDGGSLLLDLSAPTEAAALATLAKTAAAALRDAGGVDLDCTVAIRRPKRRPVTAGSAERAVALTEWDLEKSHGPASESLEGHVAILVNAHSRDPRWPNYRERLRASGYLSAASLPLTLDHGYAGALTLLAAEANVFTTLLMADVVQFRDMAARSLRLATQVRRAVRILWPPPLGPVPPERHRHCLRGDHGAEPVLLRRSDCHPRRRVQPPEYQAPAHRGIHPGRLWRPALSHQAALSGQLRETVGRTQRLPPRRIPTR